VEEVINPVTEVITKFPKVTKKFLYEVSFLSEEDKNAYVGANSSDTYTPLQEDGSVKISSNYKFDGIQGPGSTVILETVLTKSGTYVLPTTSDEDLEVQFIKDRALANATDPAHKGALAKAIAEAEQTEIIDMTAVLAQRKQARLAAQLKESASLQFGSFAEAKASAKKLDVK